MRSSPNGQRRLRGGGGGGESKGGDIDDPAKRRRQGARGQEGASGARPFSNWRHVARLCAERRWRETGGYAVEAYSHSEGMRTCLVLNPERNGKAVLDKFDVFSFEFGDFDWDDSGNEGGGGGGKGGKKGRKGE